MSPPPRTSARKSTRGRKTQPPHSTRRKQTEFESFAETTSAAIFITTGRGVLYVNPAATRCTGYARDELLGMELWQIAHPNYQLALKQLGETHSWIENIPGRYELKIVTKSSEERWLDITLGDIDYQGKPAVAVTAFDITERDRAERALRKAHDELEARVQERTAELAAANEKLNSVLSGITEAYLAFDSDWRFLVINPIAEHKILGRPASELIGKVIWDEYPQTVGQEVYRQYQLAVETGQPVHFEMPSRIAPGHWFEVHAYPRGGGMEVYSRDITERKQAEEEIASLARFPSENPNPVLRLNQAGDVLYANQASQTLLRAWASTTGDMALSYLRSLAAEAVASRANTTVDIECDERVYSFFITPIVVAGYVNLYGQDITERKKKGDELARLNRTLRALSDSSQAMMRAQDESEYLEAVCQIVVEDCGHAMVWIGFAEEDEDKTVRPVASAGFEAGYLDTLKINWADTERGRGPTGTAIRTGKPSGCRNMLTDPNFKPWRAEALKHGCASSIVLPLTGSDRVFGGINIYSKVPDSFSEEEIGLLTELANDLVYGITTLRLRTAHAQAEEALRLSEERYRALFTNMTEGFALHEILCDEQGMPCDYRFLEINPSFEQLTGLKRGEVIGKTHNEVLPDDSPRWVKRYGEVALTGQPAHFEDYSPALDRHYDVFAYCPASRQFAVLFMDITARKQAEQEREQLLEENSRQRRLLEAMFDAVPDGVTVMIGPELAFRLANPAYRALIPQPEVDPIGKGYEEVWSDPDAHHRFNILHQVFNTGEPIDTEGQKRSYPNGQLRYFSFHARRLQWNEEYAALAVLHETTETEEARRRADAAAQEAQRLAAELDATITAIADGVMIFDHNARILRMNPAAEQILGYSAEEHAMSLTERVALLQLETAEGQPLTKVEDTPVRRALRGETVHGFLMSTRIRGEKQKWLAISAAPIRTSDGRALGAVVSFTDITELRLTQQDLEQANVQLRTQTRDLESLTEALRRARDELEGRVQERTRELAQANEVLRLEIAERERVENQLRLQMTAVRAAANGIVITDRQGSIQWCNPAFTHITGYAGEEVLGQNLRLLSSGQHGVEFYRQLWETILAGEVWRGEITNRRKDGRLYIEEQTIAPVLNEQGEITHFVAVKQDITERKQAEDRLERYNQDLLALSKAERDQRQLAETLTAANLALTQSLNLDTVLGTLLDYVEQLVPYDSANVMLLEAESRLAVRLARGYERWGDAESVHAITFDTQANPVLKALLTTRQSILVPDTYRQPGWEFRPGVEHVRSWLGVPLVAGGNVIGIYSLDKTEPGFFTPEHVRVAEMLVGQAAVAIQNAWLFEQVRASRERLQSLSRRLVEAQEAERHYVARELHDEAGQALTSLLFGLGQLELQLIDPRQVEQVAELKQMTHGVLESLHRLAIDLRPASLDHLGLVPAVLQYVKAIGDRYGLIAQFKAVGLENERLPSDVEMALYRIVQEALTNIVRHAHATRADVLLERRGERVVVVVEDNGRGFDADVARFTQQGHLGLAGMQERAEMLGGSLVIESAAGAGTTVVAEVPYGNSYPHR